MDVFLFRKVQRVTVRQSPLQRRRGLASLSVSLASGNVLVPFIDQVTACRLRDYILFKAEVNNRPWY